MLKRLIRRWLGITGPSETEYVFALRKDFDQVLRVVSEMNTDLGRVMSNDLRSPEALEKAVSKIVANLPTPGRQSELSAEAIEKEVDRAVASRFHSVLIRETVREFDRELGARLKRVVAGEMPNAVSQYGLVPRAQIERVARNVVQQVINEKVAAVFGGGHLEIAYRPPQPAARRERDTLVTGADAQDIEDRGRG